MPGNLSQMTWLWTGWGGAPGYTSFYSTTTTAPELQDLVDAQKAFFEGCKGFIPAGVIISPPANYRIVDAATGNLDSFVPVTTVPASTTCTGSGTFPAPAGCSVTWLTATPAVHRTVTGRTYLVPCSSLMFQSDGTLNDTFKAGLQAAASAYVAAADPIGVIWRRPVDGAGGSVAKIVGARVNDRVSILRSRRD